MKIQGSHLRLFIMAGDQIVFSRDTDVPIEYYDNERSNALAKVFQPSQLLICF